MIRLETTVHARGKGWLLADMGVMHVNYMCAQGSLEDQLAYIDAQARAIEDAARRGSNRVVLNYSPSPLSLHPTARRKFGEVLNDKRELLTKTTRAFVLVTPSALVRGVMTAIFWLAPPPYSHTVLGSLTEGMLRAKDLDPRIDASAYEQCYRDLVQRQFQHDDVTQHA